ncbi:MAG TPA: phosphatase [Opitutaceae bacterium]|nr:phosphatase [Opitutaceae bacterium]HRJ46446.1 phosphatase [Opitutaceae bacterium]
MSTAAVLDIGSNSIKILVARRDERGRLQPVFQDTLDVRISAGINAARPVLDEEAMQRGLAAVQQLLTAAASHSPERATLVATSAVRDAVNGADFAARITKATGFELRILTGEEEANAIGRGLTCDPALADLQDFHVFDLGGGSLECLTFHGRQISQAVSLPLGCVRLTEKFVPDPGLPLSATIREKLARHIQTALAEARFQLDLPFPIAIATGGSVVTVRAIRAARQGVALDATSPIVTLRQMRELLEQTGGLSLTDRRAIPGLPPARADVFPTALATLVAVAEHAKVTAFRHSFYNLRYGLAAELLSAG